VADQAASNGRGAVAAPVARGPILVRGPSELRAGWEVATRTSTAALTLGEVQAVVKVLVRAPAHGLVAAALPPLGRAERRGDALLIGSGPGEWLLLASGMTTQELVAQFLPAPGEEFVSSVDLTHGRALLRLSGADSARTLAKVCSVNLADSFCPDRSALRAPVASVTTDIVRDDRSSLRSYLVHCERSSGQFLFEALLDAGAEFGAEAVGLLGL
jgi:heterotetrameric sarcosine oxidase gamma subunit